MIKQIINTNSEEDTIQLGNRFAKFLEPGDIVAFYGDLGAGKTEFIKGICNHFKVEEIVNSPTFTIINQYTGHTGRFEKQYFNIYHIDLYRIKLRRELEEIGLYEILNTNDSIILIEWAENAFDFLNDQIFTVTIKLDDNEEDARQFIIDSPKKELDLEF